MSKVQNNKENHANLGNKSDGLDPGISNANKSPTNENGNGCEDGPKKTCYIHPHIAF